MTIKTITLTEHKGEVYKEGVEAYNGWSNLRECPYEEHTVEHEMWCLGWQSEYNRVNGKSISNDHE